MSNTPTVDYSDSIGVNSDTIFGLLDVSLPTDFQKTVTSNALSFVMGSVKKFIRYNPVYAEYTEFHPQQPFQSQISRGIWEVMEQRATLRQVAEAATNEMQLQNLPLRSTIAIYVDYDGRSGTKSTSFGSESLKTLGQDYWPNFDCYDVEGNKVCRDGVVRTIGLWPTTPGTIKVVYYGGYKLAEFMGQGSIIDASPIRQVIIDETIRGLRKAMVQKSGKLGLPAGVLASENLGQYSYSLAQQSLQQLFGGDLLPESKEKLSEYVNWGASLGS